MVRPIKPRKILIPHGVVSFIPEGISKNRMQCVTLLSEEFEAVKLVDYENLDQKKASKVMNISRPTLTRIYKRARKKIAEGLVEIKSLKLEGGNSYLGENWYECNNCGAVFNVPENSKSEISCPMCLVNKVKRINNE